MTPTPIERIKNRLKEAIESNNGLLKTETVKNSKDLTMLYSLVVKCFETSLEIIEQEEGK